jgi:hypothetical protein
MKASSTPIKLPPPEFQPFNLNITVETKEEAQALFAIFNYTPNTDLLGNSHYSAVKDAIGPFSTSGVIARGVTYEQFYRPKKAVC